jgi:hypothetical protein
MLDSVRDRAGILHEKTWNKWSGDLNYDLKKSTIGRDKRV